MGLRAAPDPPKFKLIKTRAAMTAAAWAVPASTYSAGVGDYVADKRSDRGRRGAGNCILKLKELRFL